MHATPEVPAGDTALLKPLATFYADAGREFPKVRFVAGETMPEPYRSLLVHQSDMTSTLQRFHGVTLRIRALASRRNGNVYEREVVLLASESGKLVEFGASHLQLDLLPAEVRREILAEEMPLGAILQQHGVAFRSCPRAYFEIVSDALIDATLLLPPAQKLFGRCNRLELPDGRTIAEIVEILPPAGK